MFEDAPSNCLLPGVWLRRWNPQLRRLIVAGSRDIVQRNQVWPHIDRATEKYRASEHFELVCGMARGPDLLGLEWAKHQGLENRVAQFPAQWDEPWKKAAGFIRNSLMAWYATDLLAFWDGKSPGTKNMIETARRDGLRVEVVRV
jgi:hypothetical protein